MLPSAPAMISAPALASPPTNMDWAELFPRKTVPVMRTGAPETNTAAVDSASTGRVSVHPPWSYTATRPERLFSKTQSFMVREAPTRCTAVPLDGLYPLRMVNPSRLLDKVSPRVSERNLPLPSRSTMVCTAPPDERRRMSTPPKSSSRLRPPE